MSHYNDVLNESALETLNAVTGGDPEFLAELVDTFLEDAPILINGIKDALASGNASEVRRLAHGLKGNGMEFGATHFAEICKTLEYHAADGNLHDAHTLLSQIENEFPIVKSALEEYISAQE